MIRLVDQHGCAEHMERYHAAMGQVLPALGFAPNDTEALIGLNAQLSGDHLGVIETESRQTAYCRISRHNSGWTSHGIFPSAWMDRYQIVREAAEQIKQAFLQESGPGQELTEKIIEDAPSHNAYYSGLLPGLGFQLRPRMSMSAVLDRLMQVRVPDLRRDVHDIRFDRNRLSEMVDFYTGAWSGLEGRRCREVVEAQFIGLSEIEGVVKSWVTLESDGEIIGLCCGGVHGERVVIYELGLSPSFYGKGLGRFLLLRCARNLKEQGGESCTECFLWVWRTLRRALKLYYGLGFARVNLWTEASFSDDSAL